MREEPLTDVLTSDHDMLIADPRGPAAWLDRYPAHLTRIWTLRSGQSFTVRPVRHDDGALEEAFIRSLSRESAYQRMLSGGIKVTREWIAYMTQIDYLRHMAFAITTVSEGTEKFVGVGRYVVDAQGRSADVALVIADAWQGMGLGRRLLEILPDHARAAGVDEMAGLVLATNVRMLRLARSLGCAVSPEPGDATLLRISKTLGTDLHVDFIR